MPKFDHIPSHKRVTPERATEIIRKQQPPVRPPKKITGVQLAPTAAMTGDKR